MKIVLCVCLMVVASTFPAYGQEQSYAMEITAKQIGDPDFDSYADQMAQEMCAILGGEDSGLNRRFKWKVTIRPHEWNKILAVVEIADLPEFQGFIKNYGSLVFKATQDPKLAGKEMADQILRLQDALENKPVPPVRAPALAEDVPKENPAVEVIGAGGDEGFRKYVLAMGQELYIILEDKNSGLKRGFKWKITVFDEGQVFVHVVLEVVNYPDGEDVVKQFASATFERTTDPTIAAKKTAAQILRLEEILHKLRTLPSARPLLAEE